MICPSIGSPVTMPRAFRVTSGVGGEAVSMDRPWDRLTRLKHRLLARGGLGPAGSGDQ